MDYQYILVTNDKHEGVADGYMLSVKDNDWRAYLQERIPEDAQDIIHIIDTHSYPTVAVLNSIHLAKEHPELQAEHELIEHFKEHASYAQIILFAVDKNQIALSDSDWMEHYAEHNFYAVTENENWVLMSNDEDSILYDYAPELPKKVIIA